MMKDLVLFEEKATHELEGIADSKAAQIKAVFEPMVKMLEDFEGVYEEVMELEQSEEKCARAKRLRLDISKIRISADKVRKEQKEEYLRAGNAVQGVYNILKFAVEDKEKNLKEIEEYYEKIERERIQKIQDVRAAELEKYDADSTGLDLGNMDIAVWENYITGVKSKYEAIKEAERKAEAKRIENEKKEKLYQSRRDELAPYAQFGAYDLLSRETTEKEFADILDSLKKKKQEYAKEQEEIRKENERLKRESEKREAERKALEAKEQKEREKREAELQAEREKTRRLEKEREEKEKREAEEKRKAELAPDKDKLFTLAKELLDWKTSMKSDEAKKAISSAIELLTVAANRM